MLQVHLLQLVKHVVWVSGISSRNLKMGKSYSKCHHKKVASNSPLNSHRALTLLNVLKWLAERATHKIAESQTSVLSSRMYDKKDVKTFSPLWQTRRIWRCSPPAASLARLAGFSSSGKFGLWYYLLTHDKIGAIVMLNAGGEKTATWNPQWDVKALLRRWNLKPATYISYTWQWGVKCNWVKFHDISYFAPGYTWVFLVMPKPMKRSSNWGVSALAT